MKHGTIAQASGEPAAPRISTGEPAAHELSILIAQSIAMWERVFTLHARQDNRQPAACPTNQRRQPGDGK